MNLGLVKLDPTNLRNGVFRSLSGGAIVLFGWAILAIIKGAPLGTAIVMGCVFALFVFAPIFFVSFIKPAASGLIFDFFQMIVVFSLSCVTIFAAMHLGLSELWRGDAAKNTNGFALAIVGICALLYSVFVPAAMISFAKDAKSSGASS